MDLLLANHCTKWIMDRETESHSFVSFRADSSICKLIPTEVLRTIELETRNPRYMHRALRIYFTEYQKFWFTS